MTKEFIGPKRERFNTPEALVDLTTGERITDPEEIAEWKEKCEVAAKLRNKTAKKIAEFSDSDGEYTLDWQVWFDEGVPHRFAFKNAEDQKRAIEMIEKSGSYMVISGGDTPKRVVVTRPDI